MTLKRLAGFPRPVAVSLLALLLPAACASSTLDTELARDKVGVPVVGGVSQSGNFLSGRHAQAVRDMGEATRFIGKTLEMAPGIKDLQRRTFILLAGQGRVGEAAPLAAKVAGEGAIAPIASLTVVADHIAGRRFAEAAKKTAALPDGGLSGFMAPLLAAWTALAQGRTAALATDYLKPLLKDGSKPLYYLHKALILDFTGDADGAVKAYEDEIREQGGLSPRVVELLGNLYRRMGDADRARTFYRQYGETNPRSPVVRQALKELASGTPVEPLIGSAVDGAAESFFGIATTLSQQNARETALIFARLGLHLRPDFPVLQLLLGSILQLDNQLESANQVFYSIDRSSPYSWPSRLRAAENLNDLGRTPEAIEAMNAMAEEEPALADPLIRLGDILRARERYEEAILAYDRAFERIGELQRHHWTLLYARGIVLERSNKWERAEADFLKALEFEPEQPLVLNYLGYSWVDKGLNLDRAKKMIRRAVDLRPSDGYIVDSMGWAHFRLGEFSESVREMERAVELRPEDPVINDHLGDAYWRVGRRTEARFQWARVLTLKPEDELRAQVEAKQANGLPDL